MEHIWSRHYDYSEWREKNQHLTESQAKTQYQNELFYFKQYRQTLVEKQKRDELFSPPEPYKETPHVFKKSRGPAPPVPPLLTVPLGYPPPPPPPPAKYPPPGLGPGVPNGN